MVFLLLLGLAAPPAPAVVPALDLPAASPIPLDAPAIDTVRTLMAYAREQVVVASAQNNAELAQRHTRNASALASVLARLEKVEAAGSDDLRTPRSTIAAIRADLTGRIAALQERPLLCAHCSRALSVMWGTGKA